MQEYSHLHGMETYTEARKLVSNPSYDSDRRTALEELESELMKGSIDEPILDVMKRFACMPYCYSLQSCFGHFMRESRVDDRNTRRVADVGNAVPALHYRIAYIALCIQDSVLGRSLLGELRAIPDIDPDYIQFGSADWFWNIHVNSYVLQVSPHRNACQDHFDVSIEEALRIEDTRDRFFARLREVLSRYEDR
jgi:hypothetical protein